MNSKPPTADQRARLRRHAEDRLRQQAGNRSAAAVSPKSHADAKRLLHELQVHQIELELQNAELRQARDELEVALDNYTDLYDFAPSGYFTLAATGAIRQANLTGATLVGIERSRLLGQSFGQLIAAGFRPAFRTFLEQVFAGQTKRAGDFELVCQGQPLRFVNIEAQCLLNRQECRAAVVDITARKFAEAASTQLAAIVNSSSDAIIGKDLNSLITSWNAGAAEIFGYSVDEMLGCPISRLIPSDRRQEDAQIMSQIKRGESVKSFETLRVVKDGRQLDMSVTVSPIWSADGKIVGASMVARDITARKHAEAARVRLVEMTASNRKLEQEINRRKKLEQALKTSEQQLRQLSHEILLAQEAERKRISRELHDTVLQTLVGISVHLTSLTPKSGDKPARLRRKIAQTQLLVEKSLALVHRFAVELRPTVLDDLGLIPALHTFMKDFMKRTGVRAHLTAYAAVNSLPIEQSAVLYRVVLEALNNVALHAQASTVAVQIKQLPDWICLTITDDGKSFDVKRVLRTKGHGRLGLLGMRERLQMVHGKFSIRSTPGHGTSVIARIPVGSKSGGKAGKKSSATKP
jgi:PAS domain S-box-containing protein